MLVSRRGESDGTVLVDGGEFVKRSGQGTRELVIDDKRHFVSLTSKIDRQI